MLPDRQISRAGSNDAVCDASRVRHPDAEQPPKAWYNEARHAAWNAPQDVKNHYVSASPVDHNRVAVAVAYRFQAIYIKFVGTHAEYDRVDAATVEKP